jgi:DNA-binding response OmpR family regulator
VSRNARPLVALRMPELLGGVVRLSLQHLDCEIATAEAVAADAMLIDLDVAVQPPPRSANTAVVGLTRRREPAARLAAFSRVDDLVHVPFAPDEVVIRTLAALRRATGRDVQLRARAALGRFELDVLDGAIRLDGRAVRLTMLEQNLLYLFLSRPGVVLDRGAILASFWGHGASVTSNVIDRHIRDLRVKLQEEWRQPRFIETVAGKGYRFIAPGPASDEPRQIA